MKLLTEELMGLCLACRTTHFNGHSTQITQIQHILNVNQSNKIIPQTRCDKLIDAVALWLGLVSNLYKSSPDGHNKDLYYQRKHDGI